MQDATRRRSLSDDERREILYEMSQFAASGQAERESTETFRQTFCPIPEHLRALDPDVALVLGERGSGKSELFRIAADRAFLPALTSYIPNARVAERITARSEWVRAYPSGAEFAGPASLSRFIASSRSRDVAELWFAYLLKALRGLLSPIESQKMRPLLDAPSASADAVFAAFQALGDDPLIALDQLDRRMSESERYVIIAYDELDTLSGQAWESTLALVRGLITFWAGHMRRWSRLRPKIFLRTDMFRLQTSSLGADSTKLAANRTELYWSDANLYFMLAKRLANYGVHLREYVHDSRLEIENAGPLGFVPVVRHAEDARVLIDRMVGEFMGADNTKGVTFRWVLNHAKDGLNRALPRVFVGLFENAAAIELQNPRAVRRRIMLPASLRRAVDRVSEQQVAQAQSSEWPWIAGLKARLQRHLVPSERRAFERYLEADWDQDWGERPDPASPVRPPAADGKELLDRLYELGITRQRPKQRVDVPDLYLAGLGLKRHGGVTRK